MNRKYVKPPYHARVVSTPETEHLLIEQEYVRRHLSSRGSGQARVVPERVNPTDREICEMDLETLLAALKRYGLRAVRWPRDSEVDE